MSLKLRFVLVASALLLAAVSSSAVALPEAPSSAFQPSTSCGCHAALLEQWRPSMHAQAISDPLYLAKLEDANKATNGELGAFCDSCHSPIATMSGEQKTGNLSAVAKESVGCDMCHQVTGTEGATPGNVSIAFEPDGTKRAQFDDAVSPIHSTAYSAFHRSAEFCGNCHNVNHPVNGMHLETTYTEWKNGPYATEGIVCQDCHMTPGPGVTKPNPGKAAAMGPTRDHIYTMTFVGGNVALGDADLAEERLKAAATLDLEVEDTIAAGEKAELNTIITNVGAGHYIPTGLTEVRQMWLEVTAVNTAGEELMKERRDFGTVLEDKDGNYPAELWDATSIHSDDRIPPRESVSNDYSFTMSQGPITVTAALYYRSVPEELASKAGVDVPTTTMVSVTKTVYSSAEEKADAQDASETVQQTGMPLWAWGALVAALGAGVVAVVLYSKRHRG